MAFTSAQQFKIPRKIMNPDAEEEATITCHRTLTHASGTYQFITNNGGVTLDIILPSASHGMTFWVHNESASPHNITVMTGATILATLTPGTGAKVYSTASAWKKVLG